MGKKKKELGDVNPIAYIVLTILMAVLGLLAIYIAIAGCVDAVFFIMSGSLKGFLLYWLEKYKEELIISVVLSLIIFISFKAMGLVSHDDIFKD